MSKANKQVSFTFLILSACMITCILIANTVAGKQLAFLNWSLPAGTLVFPVTFIISDIISEVYGYSWSRKVAWLGFAMNLVMVLFYMLTLALPAPVWYEGSEAFAAVLSNTPRLLFAGLVAYLLGGWVNDIILSKMRKTAYNKRAGKGFWIRAVVSTFFGVTVDSIIFIPLAFYGVLPTAQLPQMILLQIVLKTVYELILTPFLSVLVDRIKQSEGGIVVDGKKYGIFGT